MAYSEVGISNIALRRIGVKRAIISLTEQTQEAAACAAMYPHSRDTVLDIFPWPFAMKYADLNLVTDFTSLATVHDWNFSYRYPVDCLKIRRLVTQKGRDGLNPAPFELGTDTQGALIYTDEQNAIAQYTSKVENPVRYAPSFADALAWRLAADLAMPLAISDTIRQQCEQLYTNSISQARVQARNERQLDINLDSEFVRARL